MTPKLYQLKSGFAKHNNHLIYFVAVPLFETQKAVYLYGHGTTETARIGVCCNCGRKLTHPVSVELGIGPECGQHFHDWNLIGGYTQENIERLKGAMVDIKFNSWVPKSQIDCTHETKEIVNVPPDHPMLKRRTDTLDVFSLSPAPQINNSNSNENMNIQRPPSRSLKTCQVIESKGNYTNNLIKIVFPYDLNDIANVKTLPDRRFLPEQRCWTVPVKADNLEKLKSWGFTLSPELESVLEQSRPENTVKVETLKPMVIPGLNGELFPFQGVGVTFIDLKKGRALIADDMGLGKTIQAIGWLQLHPELRPAIIVVPASVKLNWLREMTKWMSKPRCEVLSGTKPYVTKGEILIINYDIVSAWLPVLKVKGFKVLIMDEIQSIKNSTAKRTKAVKQLAKGINHVIGLSGTPIVNRPVEIYNALSIINSSAIPNFKEYTNKFCDAHYNGFGWDFKGATNTDELHRLLVNSFMIRRLKKDVLKDLPDKLKSFVPIELDNEKEYQYAEKNFIDYVRGTKGQIAAERASNAAVLAEIEGLKQLAVSGKINQCIDWISDFLETDNKLVVFAVHKFVIDKLMEAFPNISVKIDGSVSMAQRDQAVQSFQNDPKITLFVGNIQAAGVGLTLTSSSNVVFLELPWTPGALVQAEDRCHRIGQKDSVTIHYLLATDTIEEKIARLLDSKRKVIDAVMDGVKTDETSLLSELMKEYL
jgi:hypothetical protein